MGTLNTVAYCIVSPFSSVHLAQLLGVGAVRCYNQNADCIFILRLMSRYHRSTFAKFRCGILPLNIEVGRYRGVKVEDRICPMCKAGIESEIHFLLECNVYDRGNFLYETEIDSNLLSNDEKLKILMSEHQKATSVFVCNLWNQRQAKLIV